LTAHVGSADWEAHAIEKTAHNMAGDKEKSLAAGMNAHISKPIDYKTMSALLLAWLDIEKLDKR
jgi:CheY-like chemotaxis protein